MSRNLVQANQAFSVNTPNGEIMVARNDIYFDDDLVVRRAPNNFSGVEVKSSTAGRSRQTAVSSQATETASADPGLKRRVGRPPKVDRAEVTVESNSITSEV